MAVDDIFQMAVKYTIQGVHCVTTHHFKQGFATDSPEVDLHTAYGGHGKAAFREILKHAAGLDTDMTLDEITIGQVGLPDQTVRAPVTFVENLVGTRDTGGQQLPPWVTGRVTITTAVGGRRHRGRFFISGLGDQDIFHDQLVTTSLYYLEELTEYCGDGALGWYISGHGSDNFQLGVFSRRLAGFTPPETEGRVERQPAPLPRPLAAVNAFTPALALTPRRTVTSLRRRRNPL